MLFFPEAQKYRFFVLDNVSGKHLLIMAAPNSDLKSLPTIEEFDNAMPKVKGDIGHGRVFQKP